MRKLFFTALLITGFSMNALAIAQSNSIEVNTIQEKQYKKIKVEEVSKEVLTKIKKDYGNYTIKEAHRASDGEYKLILTNDGVDTTVTLTPAGEIIRIF